MIRAGAPYAYEIDFGTGTPTGAVVYSVLGNDGLALAGLEELSLAPTEGALSLVITVPGTANTVSTPLFERRRIVWSYPTVKGVVNGDHLYRVEKLVPFPVSEAGVREKLGLADHELADEKVDLLLAYADFGSRFDLTTYEASGDYASLLISHAIEALAALSVLPTLQLGVAKRETSGTNEYERFASIDWETLERELVTHIDRAVFVLDPPADAVSLGYTAFSVATRASDPLTGV